MLLFLLRLSFPQLPPSPCRSSGLSLPFLLCFSNEVKAKRTKEKERGNKRGEEETEIGICYKSQYQLTLFSLAGPPPALARRCLSFLSQDLHPVAAEQIESRRGGSAEFTLHLLAYIPSFPGASYPFPLYEPPMLQCSLYLMDLKKDFMMETTREAWGHTFHTCI